GARRCRRPQGPNARPPAKGARSPRATRRSTRCSPERARPGAPPTGKASRGSAWLLDERAQLVVQREVVDMERRVHGVGRHELDAVDDGTERGGRGNPALRDDVVVATPICAGEKQAEN